MNQKRDKEQPQKQSKIDRKAIYLGTIRVKKGPKQDYYGPRSNIIHVVYERTQRL